MSGLSAYLKNPFIVQQRVIIAMSSESQSKVPKIVALEVLEKNGVNVERLKELITKGVGAEFTTYYYYTILRMHSTGLEGEGIKEIVEDARIEDRNHFESMVPRLYEARRGPTKRYKKICRSGGLP